MRFLTITAALAAALSTSGCVEMLTRSNAAAGLPPEQAPNGSAATWQMPWQISPIASRAEAEGEQTILSYVPETGFVRGTQTALAGLGRPLEPVPGPNRTVEPCRDVVSGEAVKVGAKEIEAVSAGPDQREAGGKHVGLVRVRITYARPSGLEVREATMTCIVDRKGKIVDARA